MEVCEKYISTVICLIGVVSKALPWVFKEDKVIVGERVPKPFSTKRTEKVKEIFPRTIRFKLDPKDSRTYQASESYSSEMEIIENRAFSLREITLSTKEESIIPPEQQRESFTEGNKTSRRADSTINANLTAVNPPVDVNSRSETLMHVPPNIQISQLNQLSRLESIVESKDEDPSPVVLSPPSFKEEKSVAQQSQNYPIPDSGQVYNPQESGQIADSSNPNGMQDTDRAPPTSQGRRSLNRAEAMERSLTSFVSDISKVEDIPARVNNSDSRLLEGGQDLNLLTSGLVSELKFSESGDSAIAKMDKTEMIEHHLVGIRRTLSSLLGNGLAEEPAKEILPPPAVLGPLSGDNTVSVLPVLSSINTYTGPDIAQEPKRIEEASVLQPTSDGLSSVLKDTDVKLPDLGVMNSAPSPIDELNPPAQAPPVEETCDFVEERVGSPPLDIHQVARNTFKFTLPPVKKKLVQRKPSLKASSKPSISRPSQSRGWTVLYAAIRIQAFWRGYKTRRRKEFSRVLNQIFSDYISTSIPNTLMINSTS